MFDVKILDKCTIRQACEWIAFKWEPMSWQYEAYCGHIRPRNPYDLLSLEEMFENPPEPTYPWKKYNKAMHEACAKLTITVSQKQIVLQNTLSDGQNIDFGGDDTLDWQSNRIKSLSTTNTTDTNTDVKIDFNQLKKVFPYDKPECKKTTIKLVFEDDECVYLYTGTLQKTLVKKFAKTDNKSKRVVQYIMQHPNQLITRDDLIKANIKGFDKLDRIDTIIKNAFSNLNIYKYFFKDPKTASIEFVPQITNLDIDSEQFDKIIVK